MSTGSQAARLPGGQAHKDPSVSLTAGPGRGSWFSEFYRSLNACLSTRVGLNALLNIASHFSISFANLQNVFD